MLIFFGIYSIIAISVYSVILVLTILNSCLFGEANFNRLEMVGPYQVAHQDIHTTKYGLAVSAYYPMDR
jgi:hypothetical protein